MKDAGLFHFVMSFNSRLEARLLFRAEPHGVAVSKGIIVTFEVARGSEIVFAAHWILTRARGFVEKHDRGRILNLTQ